MGVAPAVVEGVSGAAGGIAALLTTYPLMTISTLQATRSKQGKGQRDEEQAFVVPVQRKKGTFADIAEVISTSGYQGLYRGLQPALVGTAVSQGVYFYLYSKLRTWAVEALQARGKAMTGDIGVGPSLLVAFLAGCGNVLATNPIWVVSTRMQAHHKKSEAEGGDDESAGPLTVAKEIVDESGILGLWKGVLPSLVMVANPTVNYMLYEVLLARLAELKRRRRGIPTGGSIPMASPLPTALEVFLVSALAKFGATIATYPLLLVKQRLQSAGRHTHVDRQYSGTVDAVQRIWKSEGLLGFYGGLNTKIVQSILAAALMMAIKEKLTEGTRQLLDTSITKQDINAGISAAIQKAQATPLVSAAVK